MSDTNAGRGGDGRAIEWVFFDAGETLLQPRPSFAGRATIELQLRGHDVDEDAVLAAWREAALMLRTQSSGSHDKDASHRFWTSMYARVMELLDLDDPGAPQHMYEVFSDPQTYVLYDDVVTCLARLGDRRLGIISNFEAWLDDVLVHLGVRDRFDVVAISGPLGWEKPDVRIFEWAMEQAGAKPAQCAHVGDQPHFDAEPANALGMLGVTLDRYGRFDDGLRIASLDELPGVLS